MTGPDITYSRTTNGSLSLALTLDPEVAEHWKESAKRNGLSLVEWIQLSLALADKLCLVDGYERTPSIGRRLDPVLARAILEAAQGQPWEHRAMLLLGMANPVDEDLGPMQGQRQRRVPAKLSGIFTDYGLPYVEIAPDSYAVLGDHALTWQELAVVLTLWTEGQFDWCYLSNKGLQERTGMSAYDIRRAVTRTGALKLTERESLPMAIKSRRAQYRTRLTRTAGEALLRGDLRPATVDDAYSESFLATQGSAVDPLLLQSAREAQQRGQPTASAVIKGYLEALDQA